MQESLTFQDTEVGKIKIYYHKTPFYWDIEKVLTSSKTSFGEKNYSYFIGYLQNGNKVTPLNIMLPKTSAYIKNLLWTN